MANTRLRRFKPGINAGSTADIAFLLLIFFLVTTTIEEDQGLLVKLPPYEFTSPPVPPAKNVLSVQVNGFDELMVEGHPLRLAELKERTIEFITNPDQSADLPDSPKKAIVSLKHDRACSYQAYLHVYNEIKTAYNEIWNGMAENRYGVAYEQLAKSQQKVIRAAYPQIISEAEPTNY